MNLQSQSVTAALVLYPVYLPRWKTPVLPERPGLPIPDGGLSQAASASPGVEMVIDPFTEMKKNWTMAPFDMVEIYVNNAATGESKTIYPGEENDRFLLRVPALWFIDGINNIFYRVKRLSGNFNDSRDLNVLYHDPIIGSPAPAGIDVKHPAFIGPGQTGAFIINISYMPPHSKVTLKIGAWSITFTNLTSPINHTLTSAELSLIGNGKHRVSVIAIDQLDNASVSTDTDIEIRTQDTAPDELEEFESVAEIYMRTVGQTVVSDKFKITLLAGRDKDYLAIRALDETPHVKGMVIYPYSWDNVGSITYVLKLNSGTSSRITFWMRPLNMPVNALMEARFMDASGIVLNTLQYRYQETDKLKELFFDSRALTSIDSVVFVAQGQFAVDCFGIYR